MARLKSSTGFTRIEVLVIILVAMLLLTMIPPVCHRARSDAARETCRANLAEIGKAMLIYANDYDDELPRPGGPSSRWGKVARWNATNRYQAYGMARDGSGGEASISSCFYLLVKYAVVEPRSFVCPGDTGTTPFSLFDMKDLPGGFEFIDAWDFGPEPTNHCSYAYHVPFGMYALKMSDDPKMPVAADRNPWFRSPASEPEYFPRFRADLPGYGGRPEHARNGNSFSHNRDGQNVLFVDGHVSFEERSYCGLDQDNIYTVSGLTRGGNPVGVQPVMGSMPQSRKDSFLVHEPAPAKTTATHQAQEIDSEGLKETAVLATLDCPLAKGKNAIWCSTFQMAWDKLKTDVIQEPIRIVGAEDLASRLNQAAFPMRDIEPQSYYANAGIVKSGIIEQIQKDMAQRFPSEPVPAFDSRYTTLPEVILAYAYLTVDVAFQHPYYTNDDPFTFTASDGGKSQVTSFCSYTRESDGNKAAVREQVEILHYDADDGPETATFVVDLSRRTQPYQVILARIPPGRTLNESARIMQERTEQFKKDPDYDILSELRPIDTLVVPDVLYKLTHRFKDLLDKPLGNPQWGNHFLFEAVQKIDFTLSRTGVVLKSEAMMGGAASRSSPQQLAKPRHLRFDKPFLICVKKREAGATPFFLMWVDNAELMQKQ